MVENDAPSRWRPLWQAIGMNVRFVAAALLSLSPLSAYAENPAYVVPPAPQDMQGRDLSAVGSAAADSGADPASDVRTGAGAGRGSEDA